jgi:hypothetical protein
MSSNIETFDKKDKMKEYCIKYYEKNKNKIRETNKQLNKEYYIKNKDKIKEKNNKRYHDKKQKREETIINIITS